MGLKKKSYLEVTWVFFHSPFVDVLMESKEHALPLHCWGHYVREWLSLWHSGFIYCLFVQLSFIRCLIFWPCKSGKPHLKESKYTLMAGFEPLTLLPKIYCFFFLSHQGRELIWEHHHHAVSLSGLVWRTTCPCFASIAD